MTVELWVEVVAAGLALWAVALSIPRPPALQWERLFKVGLSVVTAGRVEEERGSTDKQAQQEWADRVLGHVLWHPAGRDAEAKLSHARLDEIPVPALSGERVLVEALATIDGPGPRLARMYVDDEHARNELLGDPAVLGQDHDPAVILGPDAGWDHVASWDAALQTVLSRRMDGVVLVLDGLPPALADAVSGAVDGLRCVVAPRLPDPSTPTDETHVEAFFEVVEAALTADSDRVVIVAAGRSVQRTLATLVAGAGLRDRTLAVLSVGGRIQTPEFQPWLDEHFDANALDTELRRTVPYLHIVDVDPADPLAEPWRVQRFPQPPAHPSGRQPVEVVDLGPLHLAGVEPLVLARGLVLLLALRLTSQG
ncbi:MAG: hypothetical protein H6742_12705 [Alphaproteobacteria bacterium]|nr:hypothetical protein [Alphaproteobacteria bacterium]